MSSIVEQIEPTGFIGDYISYASKLTDAAIEFHLGAALTSLAACCGSKIIFPGHGGATLWPNLYTLLIAPSGLYRKTTCVQIAERLITQVDPTIIFKNPISPEMFALMLKENPTVLYPISEFSMVLSQWQREFAMGMRERVVDLFDCHEAVYWASRKEGMVEIKRPALNILAASTLDWLREKLTEGDMRGGLMGRFLIFPGIHKQDDPGILEINSGGGDFMALADWLKALCSFGKTANVRISEVQTEFNEWVRKAERKMTHESNPDILGFQARLGPHALKLAVLLCVSDARQPQPQYTVTTEHFQKATALGEWLIRQATDLAETGFAKSKIEQQVQKLLAMADRNGGVMRRDAMQLMHVSAREFDSVVLTAVERGQLRVEKEVGATKPSIWYTLAPAKPVEIV